VPGLSIGQPNKEKEKRGINKKQTQGGVEKKKTKKKLKHNGNTRGHSISQSTKREGLTK